MSSLLVRSGPDAGRRFPLAGDVITLGRHSASNIVLNDDRVSRHHLELRAVGNGWQLHDLGSGNGTLVNNAAAAQCDLKPGDSLSVGDTVLLFEDDDARFRTSIVRTVPENAGGQILANLGVLYKASAAVSHILDVDELLGKILDLVIEATNADHAGALLIDDSTGELVPRTVRSRVSSGFQFSRTIVDYVRREKQGVLVSDAAADDRFQGGESIVRRGFLEVICVPMRGRHDTVGQIFLDTLSSTAERRFTESHLELTVAIAHQAALAIEETRYYRALLNTERLAAVGQTIAGMSHHIKNIMQGVRFGGDMIRSGLGANDRELIAKGWNLVEKNQKRIDTLIGDMLSYSKEREPILENADPAALIQDVINVVRGRADECGIDIRFQIPSGLGSVLCDADAIHAALLNLMTNAIDALEDIADGQIIVTAGSDESCFRIEVEDNGEGIPAEKLAAVFEPFISTKGSRGTGLGLPVSRKILREHGGDLVAEPREPCGVRFRMTLPLRKSISRNPEC